MNEKNKSNIRIQFVILENLVFKKSEKFQLYWLRYSQKHPLIFSKRS